jgi:(p)ppGpp synthase/HD superfamily hydrolase
MEVRDVNKVLEIAKELALKYHANQKDLGGESYIKHIEAVVAGVNTTEEKIVAYLHDILEDTPLFPNDLLVKGIPQNLINAVQLLTKGIGSSDEYFKKIKRNPLARVVKMSDLKHNAQISRLKNLTAKDFVRVEEYKKYYEFLSGQKMT